MPVRWEVVGECVLLTWESVISHASPVNVLSAFIVFNSIMVYSNYQKATRQQLITLCLVESSFIVLWILGLVALHLAGTEQI